MWSFLWFEKSSLFCLTTTVRVILGFCEPMACQVTPCWNRGCFSLSVLQLQPAICWTLIPNTNFLWTCSLCLDSLSLTPLVVWLSNSSLGVTYYEAPPETHKLHSSLLLCTSRALRHPIPYQLAELPRCRLSKVSHYFFNFLFILSPQKS